MSNYKNLFSGKRDTKESGGSDSILAKMFANIINDTGINFDKWNMLMNTYIRDPRNSIPNNDRDQSSERGNLRKELLKDKMTWKVFCKGMRLLNFPRFDLTFTVYHNDPKKTISSHTIKVSLGQANEEPDTDTGTTKKGKETIP